MSDDWQRSRERAVTIYGCLLAGLLAFLIGTQYPSIVHAFAMLP